MSARLISTAELAALSELHRAATTLLPIRGALSIEVSLISPEVHDKAAENYFAKLRTFLAIANAPSGAQ